MPKKDWTEEEKKAFGEKMKAARAAKQTAERLEKKSPTDSSEDVEKLLARMQELQQEINAIKSQGSQVQTQQPRVGATGLTGTFEKYSTRRDYYPDPTERLADEAKLQSQAFKHNFELKWDISTTSYKTIDGINTAEPRFTLTLIRKMLDDDGEDTNQRFDVCNLVFHEDPDAALIIARDNGIDVEQFGEKEFLDEMRYLRMRDWLFECFFPAKVSPQQKKKQTVIGNRLVEVYEVNGENTQSIPFGTLKGKI